MMCNLWNSNIYKTSLQNNLKMLFHLATYHIFRFIGTHYSFNFFNTIVTDTEHIWLLLVFGLMLYTELVRLSADRLPAMPIMGGDFQTPERVKRL